MSLYFIANNLLFALELIGALMFLVMAWLAIDAYNAGKQSSSLIRAIGFLFVGIWQVLYAFTFLSDIANFIGFSIYILGLILIIFSFLSTPKIAAVSAVLLIPSFTGVLPSLQIVATILLGTLSYLSYRQIKQEFNKSLWPLCIGFISLTISALIQTTSGALSSENLLWYIAHTIEAVGYVSFAFYGWQYLKLRIRESLVLIFISMTLFIATIVTLAFSTILISKIEQETRNNLLTNVKVFDFFVSNLIDESSAEAKFIASDKAISDALFSNNTADLQAKLSQYLDTENLGLLLVTDKSGAVVMRAHSTSLYGDSISKERAVEEALVGNSFTTIEDSTVEKFSIRAAAPVYKDGKVIGAVIAGFPLDNVMVDGIKKITGLDTTLYQSDVTIATTALSRDGRNRLTGALLEDSGVRESVLVNGGTATDRVVIKGTPYLASYIPIKNTDGKIIGMFSSLKPQADIIEIANSTNRLTLITVTALLLLLAFPIFALTKRMLSNL